MSGLLDRLQGSRAVVTGGAKGIGAAISRRLAAEGAHVVILDIDAAAGTALAAEIGATFAAVDLTDFDQITEAIATFGPFDVVVNNAGVDQHAFFTKTTPKEWRFLLAINLEAVFAVTHAALPMMQKQGYGRLIFIGSEAGRMGSKGGAIYATAKAGLIGFSKSMAMENARFGITANVVAPGPIRTPLLESAVAAAGDKLLKAMEGSTLLNRLGDPEDVAAMVAFLASREAGYITGETVGVSGGMSLGTA